MADAALPARARGLGYDAVLRRDPRAHAVDADEARHRQRSGNRGRVHREDAAAIRSRRSLGVSRTARRWALLRDDEWSLRRLSGAAAAIVNLHGGTRPLAELSRTVAWSTSRPTPASSRSSWRPVEATVEFLEHHTAFFSFAENLGARDCRLPVDDRRSNQCF